MIAGVIGAAVGALFMAGWIEFVNRPEVIKLTFSYEVGESGDWEASWREAYEKGAWP